MAVYIQVAVFQDVTPCSECCGRISKSTRILLKMEAARSSETSVSFHNIASCHIPKDRYLSTVKFVERISLLSLTVSCNLNLH
jgi:hypothetical protein